MDLETITAHIVAAFPTLDAFEQRLSIELYRQLAMGKAVASSALAQQLNVDVATVERSLQRWPGVYRDDHQRVIGYWGLSIPSAYSSSHVFSIAGRDLSAWCAWDTLFLPQLLGMSARVTSVSPENDAQISLEIAPERVLRIDPLDATISLLLPDHRAVQSNVVTSFCHFVHFFPSRPGW